MASNYPASLDTFTTKVDHVDNYEASHVNDLQNAIIAIQTELGADPAGAASNLVTRLKSLMDAYACTTTATGDNQVLTDASNGLHFVTPSAAIDYTLPVVGSANHPFAIMNLSDTYSITVKNSNGTTIGTVAPGEGRTFVSNSNAWVDTSISVAASSIPDTTAANDFLVGDGTDWQKKILAETQTILGIDNDWIKIQGACTYVGATSFKIAGDYTGIIGVGDKIKLTNLSVKKFYVAAISYSSPNTTVTVTAGSDFSLVSAAITTPYYSHGNPPDFPSWFNLTAPTVTTSGTNFTNPPTINVAKFCVIDRLLFVGLKATTANPSGGTGRFAFTFTPGELPTFANGASGVAFNFMTYVTGSSWLSASAQNVINCAKYDGGEIAGGNGHVFTINISVEI